MPFIQKPVIKIITGMRRVGKSTLMQMMENHLLEQGVSSSQILFISKESLEFDFIQNYQDLYQYVKTQTAGLKGTVYLFIDEIQEIEHWEKAVTAFLADEVADIYISGSNAHLLSSEMATLISGRYVEIPVYPLTFKEFLDFRKSGESSHRIEEEFSNYLKYGGLPGIHALEFREEVIFQYLNSIFNTILLKDVVSRNRIRDVGQLENIARYVFDNCGNILAAKRISDYLKSQRIKVSMDTVQNYLNHLRMAFLIFKAMRFDLKGKRHLEVLEKYYMGDIGLRHAFLGYKDRDISGLLENVVYLELLFRGYQVSVGKLNGTEIDFIAEKQNEKIYIQVCYLLASSETVEREFRPLEQIDDNFPKLVLSMDKDWGEGRKGIMRKSVIDFLLGG